LPTQKIKKTWLLVPIIGSFLFIILYVIAASLYPGGSQADKNSTGYSVTGNYWCNLLYKNGINGGRNPGQPFAAAGMFVICFALSCFWIFFPIQIGSKKYHRILIQIPGVAAMASSFLLLTDLDHDLVINTSSTLGFIAFVGTIIALYKIKLYKLFALGVFNIILVGLNNYLYHAKGMMAYLPVVQKFSFISFLIWFCLICSVLLSKRWHPANV